MKAKYTDSELQKTAGDIVNSDVYLNVDAAISMMWDRRAYLGGIDELALNVLIYGHGLDPDQCAPCSWWAVSERLYQQLADKDEPTAEVLGWYVWGRVSGGQAIMLDSVFEELAVERLDFNAELKRKYS